MYAGGEHQREEKQATREDATGSSNRDTLTATSFYA